MSKYLTPSAVADPDSQLGCVVLTLLQFTSLGTDVSIKSLDYHDCEDAN